MQPWLPASCPGLPAAPLTLHSMPVILAGSARTCWHCSVGPARRHMWLQGSWWSRPHSEHALPVEASPCRQQMPGAFKMTFKLPGLPGLLTKSLALLTKMGTTDTQMC